MTIAVIGHGRSPEGKGWGSKIDTCRTVVRMWDWEWQHAVDYGERYDYGLFVLTPKGLRIFTEYNKRQPNRSWLAYLGKPTSGVLPSPVEIVDTTDWCDKARGLGGAGLSGVLTLTRGCAAACWAITRARANDAVILVGFDNVCVGINQPIETSFNPRYWDLYMSRFKPDKEKVYPIGGAKTATHDMSIEKPLLAMLAHQHNVQLKFAQEVW